MQTFYTHPVELVIDRVDFNVPLDIKTVDFIDNQTYVTT